MPKVSWNDNVTPEEGWCDRHELVREEGDALSIVYVSHMHATGEVGMEAASQDRRAIFEALQAGDSYIPIRLTSGVERSSFGLTGPVRDPKIISPGTEWVLVLPVVGSSEREQLTQLLR